ncbi:DUF2335 domain-containing protein [Streptomyces sp. NBC_00669]|uniref:DUF2335 domain-containing protein n=1 Tax=Streptomyces sp. NBC_00669 TaxID=2976011 RepID=UPI003FA7AAD7
MAERKSYWTGFPDAQEIRELNAEMPGLGERAFAMVERQQRHEHHARWAGIFLSAITSIGTLAGASYFIAHGHETGGSALAGSGALGVAATYASRLRSGRTGSHDDAPSQATPTLTGTAAAE